MSCRRRGRRTAWRTATSPFSSLIGRRELRRYRSIAQGGSGLRPLLTLDVNDPRRDSLRQVARVRRDLRVTNPKVDTCQALHLGQSRLSLGIADCAIVALTRHHNGVIMAPWI